LCEGRLVELLSLESDAIARPLDAASSDILPLFFRRNSENYVSKNDFKCCCELEGMSSSVGSATSATAYNSINNQ